MPIHGDMGALKKLADRIREVSSAGFRQELGQVLGAAAVKLVADGFRQERDPYGRAWESLKYRKGKILRKTGRMANAVAVEPRPNGFKLTIATVYAPVHQYGATIAPHSRIGKQVMWRNPKTGRLVSRTTKLSLVHESVSNHRTYGKGITIPQRQMVPMGDLGSIWAIAFATEAASLLRRRLRTAA